MRSFFDSRTQREKFLILFMMAVGLLIWTSFFTERYSALMQQRRTLNQTLEEQRVWLGESEAIRAAVEIGMENLDPSRTLNAVQLAGETGALARANGLSPTIATPRTEAGDVFSYNTLTLTATKAELPALINFTNALQERAPYIGIEQVIITADRTNPMLLDARYDISSVVVNP